MSDFSKLTPAPWSSNCFLTTARNGREVTHTGLLGRRKASSDGHSGGEEDEVNAAFIALARNFADVCERNGWGTELSEKGWRLTFPKLALLRGEIPIEIQSATFNSVFEAWQGAVDYDAKLKEKS